jgi:hypothetical protein
MRESTSWPWSVRAICRKQITIVGLALCLFCPAAHAAVVWQPGDLISYNQASWTTSADGSAALTNNYFSVYLSTFGVVEIGVPGDAGYSVQFTSPTTISDFIPTNGPPAALTGDLVDPVTTSAGIFAGDVLAVQLDMDFADHGALSGNSDFLFGDLVLHGFSGSVAGLNGLSVRTVDVIINNSLGGGTTGYTIDDLDLIAEELGNSFDDGTVSTWAQDHLAAPDTAAVPEPSTWVSMLIGFILMAVVLRWKRMKPRQAQRT